MGSFKRPHAFDPLDMERAIELLLRTQNELLTSVLVEPEQNKRCAEATSCPF